LWRLLLIICGDFPSRESLFSSVFVGPPPRVVGDPRIGRGALEHVPSPVLRAVDSPSQANSQNMRCDEGTKKLAVFAWAAETAGLRLFGKNCSSHLIIVQALSAKLDVVACSTARSGADEEGRPGTRLLLTFAAASLDGVSQLGTPKLKFDSSVS
jgi:hypothetical protein